MMIKAVVNAPHFNEALSSVVDVAPMPMRGRRYPPSNNSVVMVHSHRFARSLRVMVDAGTLATVGAVAQLIDTHSTSHNAVIMHE